MAGWSEVEIEAPELAARAKGFLDAHTHLTLATLRRGGSPRISGTEIRWHDGELFIGSMWKAMKALDLRRDPRYALHSGSDDPDDGWAGDGKVAGRAEEITDEVRLRELVPEAEHPERLHLFRLDVSELVVVGLDEAREQMLVEAWHEGRGLSLTR
jgi:hypothetical protein